MKQSLCAEEDFENVKHLVSLYDVTKPTVISTDATNYGVGGVLLQDPDGHLKPVQLKQSQGEQKLPNL